MDGVAILCDECFTQGEEFTVGFSYPFSCSKCGKRCDYHPHPVDAKYIWPRPIPVSERLPEHEQHCLVYVAGEDGPLENDEWAVAFLNYYRDGRREWCFLDQCMEFTRRTPDASEITHWLPLPSKPECVMTREELEQALKAEIHQALADGTISPDGIFQRGS